MAEESRVGKHLARRYISVQLVVDITLWLTVALPVLYLFVAGKPYVQGFVCDDPRLSYPYKPDTVSTPVLIVVGLVTSIAVLVVVEVLNCADSKCRRACRSPGGITYCVKSYAVFLVGFIIQELFVDAIKNNLGVLRPNFFDVCRPEFNKTFCPGYITEYACTTDDHNADEILKSRQSFPSGHSAFSMYIALYFSVYIQRALQIQFSRILKLLLQCALIFAAIICGLGRIKDNKHHPSDVIAGFFIGSSVALIVQWKVVDKKVSNFNKVSPSTAFKLENKTNRNASRNCCRACAQPEDESEPQSPSSLLTHEFFTDVRTGQTTQSCKEHKQLNSECACLIKPERRMRSEENV